MHEDLKQKALKGFIWNISERFGVQGIHFIIGIILARLLLPADYGLIAMLTIFFAVSQIFIESGFSMALIQNRESTREDESAVFFFNVFTSILMIVFLWLTAPIIADFYNQPLLKKLTRIMSFNLLFNSFTIVQNTRLVKKLNFKSLAKIKIILSIFSGIIGISFAYKGFGVWSLVAQQMTFNLGLVIGLSIITVWTPALNIKVKNLKILWNFGSKILIASLIRELFENLSQLIIGKMFSAADLGFYSRAKHLQQLPAKNIANALGAVSFPIFSIIQNEKIKLKKALSEYLQGVTLFMFPLMLTLIVLSKPLVLLLLTDKWLPIVPYFQWMCIIGALYPINLINIQAILAAGRSDLFLRLEIAKMILRTLSLVISLRWGVLAIIIGEVIYTFIALFLNSYFTYKLFNYSFLDQFVDSIPGFTIGLVVSLPLIFLDHLLELKLFIELPLLLFFAAASFLLINIFIKPKPIVFLIAKYKIMRAG